MGSTNAEFAQLVATHGYRSDLLFRLSVLIVDLPPLRERDDDVVVLARAATTSAGGTGAAPRRCTLTQSRTLRAHSWPGNVRELENLIHREFLLDDEPEIALRHLTPLRAGTTGNDAAHCATRNRRNRLRAPRFVRPRRGRLRTSSGAMLPNFCNAPMATSVWRRDSQARNAAGSGN